MPAPRNRGTARGSPSSAFIALSASSGPGRRDAARPPSDPARRFSAGWWEPQGRHLETGRARCSRVSATGCGTASGPAEQCAVRGRWAARRGRP